MIFFAVAKASNSASRGLHRRLEIRGLLHAVLVDGVQVGLVLLEILVHVRQVTLGSRLRLRRRGLVLLLVVHVVRDRLLQELVVVLGVHLRLPRVSELRLRVRSHVFSTSMTPPLEPLYAAGSGAPI